MTKIQQFARDLRSMRRQVSKLQCDLSDMLDHVAVLECRAKNSGKATSSPAQIRARLEMRVATQR